MGKRLLKVTPDELVAAFNGTTWVSSNLEGWPSDIQIERSGYSHESNTFYVVLLSASFSAVEEGSLIPEFEVKLLDCHTAST